MMNPYVEMIEIVRELDAAGAPYALCGGLALGLHGHVRATKDIDLLILPADLPKIKAAVQAAGFTLEAFPMTFRAGTEAETRIHRVSKPMGEELLMLDLIEVGPSLQGIWDDRKTYETTKGPLTAVSREGLIIMKRRAGRTQDLADIERLEETTSDA